MKNEYQHVIADGTINIGYILGSKKVLFVKTGQGGSIYGFKNKYLNLAVEINTAYGLSVFVSATTSDSEELFQREITVLEKTINAKEIEIYYLGVSKGGLIGIWHGKNEERIKKIVTINAPLMINFHNKTLPNIKKYEKEKLLMIYGSLDPSYKYIPFVENVVEVKTVDGADHNFQNSSVTLMDIFSKYIYRDTKYVRKG